MLTSKHRLRTMRDFKHLYKKGKSLGNRELMVRAVKTNEGDPLRFAFVISVKTEKTAVGRNRAKRQLRAIVRDELPKLKEGYDIAITAKKSFLPLEFEQKTKSVIDVLKKAKVYK